MTAMPNLKTLRPAEFQFDQLAALAQRHFAMLTVGRDPELIVRVDAAIGLLELIMPGRAYQDLPGGLFELARGTPDFGLLLAARLLSSVVVRSNVRKVPDALLSELRRQATRILSLDTASLDDDAFRKDLSICLLLSFPCVAQVVEQTGSIPRRALTTGGIGQTLRMARYLTATRWRKGPYLEIHTHTPMLANFSPEGWNRCYTLVAELLKQRPNCLGLVGGSWFYDPVLAKISPRLGYLAETPIASGAFRVRLAASEADAELATATSPTRRKRVQEGKYVPTRWLLIWPRDALLSWAADRARARQ